MTARFLAHGADGGGGISEAVWLILALTVLGVLLWRSRRERTAQPLSSDLEGSDDADEPLDTTTD